MRAARAGKGTCTPRTLHEVDGPVVREGQGVWSTSSDSPKPTSEMGSLDGLCNALVERIADRIAEKLKPQPLSKEYPRVLTPEQAAEFVQLKKSWLMAKARAGEVRSMKAGHYRRFDREDLLADLKDLKPEGTK